MANIVIKKNFVDGDKLFAQQLNNNFETIEKGINDGNKIVLQDGTEVKFKRYVTNDIDSLPILDGSIIYDTEKGRHYIDYQGKRVQVGSAGKEVLVQEEQPTEEDNKIWIESDIVNTMGTEIVNQRADSIALGYSTKYLNQKLDSLENLKIIEAYIASDNATKSYDISNLKDGNQDYTAYTFEVLGVHNSSHYCWRKYVVRFKDNSSYIIEVASKQVGNVNLNLSINNDNLVVTSVGSYGTAFQLIIFD